MILFMYMSAMSRASVLCVCVCVCVWVCARVCVLRQVTINIPWQPLLKAKILLQSLAALCITHTQKKQKHTHTSTHTPCNNYSSPLSVCLGASWLALTYCQSSLRAQAWHTSTECGVTGTFQAVRINPPNTAPAFRFRTKEKKKHTFSLWVSLATLTLQ